jgi:hypothetical protein
MAVVVALASSACSRKTPDAAPAASTSAPTPAAVAAKPAPEAGRAASASATKPGPPAPKAITAEDKAKHLSYGEALAKGRRATVAQHYDEAIAAFGQAIQQGDLDGRAYAERGYAYYLSKRYDLALPDLQGAVETPSDASLLAQVFFNLGLVYSALGRGAEADRAFLWSNDLHPTTAAAARIAGKQICPIAVDRTRVPAQGYSGWLEWANAMASADGGSLISTGYQPDATEAEAVNRYCPSDCKDDGPWAVNFGAFEGTWPQFWETHVMARGNGKVWDYGVVGGGAMGPVTGEPCLNSDDVRLDVKGHLAFVTTESFPLLRFPVVTGEHGDPRDCPSYGTEDCQRVCMGSSATRTFTVFAIDQHARVLTAVQDNHFDRSESPPPFDTKVEVTPAGLKVDLTACGVIAP